MEIGQLRALQAIAETGTFTAAAERVHVSQAAISMRIRQLEQEIGLPLFTRASHQCLLTHAGEVLLERAQRILREHDAAREEMAELAGATRGRLRLGTSSTTFSSGPLPALLKELRALHPQAEVTVGSGTSEALVRQILAGEIDLAFVSMPVEARGVQTELLLEDELIAIAAPDHPLARKGVISAFALAGEPLILGERGGNTRRLIDEFFAEVGLKPKVVMELSRLAAIKRMAEAGLGVGIVPVQSASEEIKAGRLVRWWIEGARINSEIGLARLRGGYQSPLMQAFTRLCREHFAAATRGAAQARQPATRKQTKQADKKKKGRVRG
jgi:DNA-binding transcriptional LysR family regulator